MKKLLFFSFVSFLIICSVAIVYFLSPTQSKSLFFIRLDDSVRGKIRPYAQMLVDELNKTNAPLDKPYRLYTARFDLDSPIKKLAKHDDKAVLWLGGERVVDFRDMRNYDTVLMAQSLFVHLFPNAYYFPIPFKETKLQKRKPEIYALINVPPFVENILREKKIPYRFYDTQNEAELRKDMPLFKAVFTHKDGLNKADINLHPIFLELAAQGIPIVGYRHKVDNMDELNVLGDSVLYYHSADDAQQLLRKIENKMPEVMKTADDAQNFARTALEIKQQAKRLSYILKNKKNIYFDIHADVNIDTLGKAGDYHYGDYWFGHDLGSALEKKNLKIAYSFLNYPLLYHTPINIIIRGHLQQFNRMENNIFWLAYPSHIPENQSIDEYSQSVVRLCQNFDAMVLSSEKIFENIHNSCPSSYYIPQFTDIRKFYPDKDDSLKSEVLFIGNAHFKREAPLIVLKNGLPIDIYGNYWEDGIAKDTYIDNRVLRKYYSSAKIVLNDTLPLMRQYGFISNRVYDVTASGGFLISDYMPEIEEIYGDTIPMWKTEKELVELVKYYLNPKHEAERLDKAKRAREITLKNFTSDIVAEKIIDVIEQIKKEKGLK